MQKRLKEIVIYILENGGELDAEQRGRLENMRSDLASAGLPPAAIEEAIRQVLELGVGRLGGGERMPAVDGSDLAPEAGDYLRRLAAAGLIDELQVEEIVDRARRLNPEGATLAQVQFLAASLIFDENLGLAWGLAGDFTPPGPPLH